MCQSSNLHSQANNSFSLDLDRSADMPKKAKHKRFNRLSPRDRPLELYIYDWVCRFLFGVKARYFNQSLRAANEKDKNALQTAIRNLSDSSISLSESILSAVKTQLPAYEALLDLKPRVDMDEKIMALQPYLTLIRSNRVRVEVISSYPSHMPLGVICIGDEPIKKGTLLTDLPGIIVPLSANLLRYLQRNKGEFSIVAFPAFTTPYCNQRLDPQDESVSSTAKKSALQRNKKDQFVLVGPLSFVNGACENHANVIAARLGAEWEEQHAAWQRCTTSDAIQTGRELLVYYGDEYRLTCIQCS